ERLPQAGMLGDQRGHERPRREQSDAFATFATPPSQLSGCGGSLGCSPGVSLGGLRVVSQAIATVATRLRQVPQVGDNLWIGGRARGQRPDRTYSGPRTRRKGRDF